MRRKLIDNLKNIPGWRTDEKLVVLAVDDYGSVRLDSAAARDRLSSAGLKLTRRFDRFDSLETKQDLSALFDVLSSVADVAGSPVVLTPYVLCANPAFRSIDDRYRLEELPQTFARMAAEQPSFYDGAWSLWQEGIRKGLLRPQFHGREHFNLELFERKLRSGDKGLAINVENRSLAGIDEDASMPGVGFTHAFGLWNRNEIERHREVISDGLRRFKDIFGFSSTTFAPPALRLHPELFSFVESLGITAIDKPFRCERRVDRDEVLNEVNSLGYRPGQGHISIVRNVVFEPTSDTGLDSVRSAMSQIGAAFRWHKPAIVSSHRVNFCGHIDSSNRRLGLDALGRLLTDVVNRWPDAKFIGADQLAQKIGRGTL